MRAKKIRVLMFCSYFPPQYSGAAKQAISLAQYLRTRGHHIEFITIKWAGLQEEDTVDGFLIHRIEQGHGEKHRELRLWGNLLRYVLNRRLDFDIFHSHGAYYKNSIVGPLSKLIGWKSLVKASLSSNDLNGLRTTISGHLHYRFLKMVDAYIAISRDIESEFLASDLSAEKIYYLPNGVDTRRFQPVKSEEKRFLRHALGLPEDRLIALSVGVFDQRKNIGWLMEEWVRNNAFVPGAFLLTIGPQSREDVDGGYLKSLKLLAKKNSSLMRLMDYVDSIEQYYQAVDLFILPSHSEGMPNVILEAMASGLPCVATEVSGIQELIIEGKTGYTFAINDVKGLRDAILKTIGDTGGTMGCYAREVIEEKYSLSGLAERYEHLYQKLLGINGTG